MIRWGMVTLDTTDPRTIAERWAEHRGTRGDDSFSWDTFARPDGNEFCIGDPHE